MANMKKILDERAKHRVVGLIVVFALMIIILPAMMRESDKHFDEFPSYHMPKRPPLPKISLTEKDTMLRSVKMASVSVPRPDAPVRMHIASAQPLSPKETQDELHQTTQVAVQKQEKSATKALRYNEAFTIQLAAFNKEANAQALIRTLQAQGFAARQHIVKTPQGVVYQVIVGRTKRREQAVDLQKKLVDNTQLNGLIIKTKVS